jgi:hypothetical protein
MGQSHPGPFYVAGFWQFHQEGKKVPLLNIYMSILYRHVCKALSVRAFPGGTNHGRLRLVSVDGGIGAGRLRI